jgi:hypothetical protein
VTQERKILKMKARYFGGSKMCSEVFRIRKDPGKGANYNYFLFGIPWLQLWWVLPVEK